MQLTAIKELMSLHLNQFEELINYDPDRALIELKDLLNEIELIKTELVGLLIKAEDEKKEMNRICF